MKKLKHSLTKYNAIALYIALLCIPYLSFSQLSNSCGQQNVYWSDDFESAISGWSATNGVWQIGTPSTGPNNSHSGIKCAATNLNGNYPKNITTILSTNQFISIPPAVQNPRLRFWMWYSFATTNGNDYGKVQIKSSTSNWIDLSTITYIANSSGVWSYEEIDLSSFADSVIKIGFFLNSANDNYQSSGIYIDDVEILTGPYIHINNESFENGWNDWSAEGSWEIGTPVAGPTSGCTGSKCAGTNLSGNYGKESIGHLKSPWIKLPEANQAPSISFCHWFSFATTNGLDIGKLQFRTQTSGWKDTATYSSSSLLWSSVYFDMSYYADSIIQFGFYLQSLYDNYQSTGWYIDDVYINGLPDTSCLYVGGTVGEVEHESVNHEIEVYPNPSSGSFNVVIPKIFKNGNISIKNIIGNELLTSKIASEYDLKLQLENFSPGLYYVTVRDEKYMSTRKILINQ